MRTGLRGQAVFWRQLIDIIYLSVCLSVLLCVYIFSKYATCIYFLKKLLEDALELKNDQKKKKKKKKGKKKEKKRSKLKTEYKKKNKQKKTL